MTWQKERSRWRKTFRGRVFLFSAPSKSDRQSEREAWAAWLIWEAEQRADLEQNKPHRETYEAATEVRLELSRWIGSELEALERTGEAPDDEGDDERGKSEPEEWRAYLVRWRDRIAGELRTLERCFSTDNPKPLNRPDTVFAWPFESASEEEERRWLRRLDTLSNFKRFRVETEVPEDRTVQAAAARHVQDKAATCKPSTVRRLTQRLETLTDWRGADDVRNINGAWLGDYRSHLLARVKGGRSAGDAKETMNAARGLVRWLWEREEIDNLPRNLRKAKIVAPTNVPETYPPDLLRPMIDATPNRIRCHLLVMANTSSTAADLSELELGQIDLEAGTLTRKRTKHDSRPNAPTVTYVLWDDTLEALEIELENRPEPQPGCEKLALLTSEGGRLLYFTPRTGKADSRTDNVGNVIKKWAGRKATREAVGRDVPTNLQRWRKTGATLLRAEKDFADLAELWQANAPVGVTDRHYAAAPLARLTDATAHLGRVYGFETSPERLERVRSALG